MEYRTFGRTGQQVSSLGFGGGPAGVPNYLMNWDSSSPETQSAVERAVRRALDRASPTSTPPLATAAASARR